MPYCLIDMVVGVAFVESLCITEWNFCRLSSALCTVEWNYLYLQWVVGGVIPFLCGLFTEQKNKKSKSEVIFAFAVAVNVTVNLSNI